MNFEFDNFSVEMVSEEQGQVLVGTFLLVVILPIGNLPSWSFKTLDKFKKDANHYH